MPFEHTTCPRCGERFPAYRARVPGVRPGTTKDGPGRGVCGVCEPVGDGTDWAALAARRRVVRTDEDERE